MNISLNWLKRYIEIDIPPAEISEILTAIGLEVEGVEEIETIRGGLEGIVIGHVIECGKHPNADKLSLCKVDVGNAETLQIVCGAPNVAKGQNVLVASVGTTLYTPEGESWKIKKGKIRGEFSEGMICAEDELSLGDDHSGIIVLPENVEIGGLAKDLYDIENDLVFEIGLTPNRSDATSHMGVAQDLAAYLKVNSDHNGKVKQPDVSAFKEGKKNDRLKVELIDQKGAPRYSGVLLENLVIKESPDWIKNALRAIGINPKNNVVDITNFVLHELGQPLHAFDADKIKGLHIKVETLPKDSSFLDLEGKERKLHPEDVMICDGEDKGMCIGGVFGGLESGVSDSTTRIFLESAHFNAKSIRKTSTRHGLRTDAAVIFEKGSDPNITVTALKRASLLLMEYAEGQIASELIDIYPEVIEPKKVAVKYSHVNRLIGVDISKEKVHEILDALHINIKTENEDDLEVEIPTNKADVTREADVIEEILRIYGFNKVGIPERVVSTISYKPKPDKPALRDKIANLLCGFGFSEMMAVSFNEAKYYEDTEQDKLVFINNTSNIHLNVMRADMIHSALEAIAYNANRQEYNIKLFEFGRIYWRDGDEILEREKLSFCLTGNIYNESWIGQSENEQDQIYYLKAAVNNILDTLGASSYQVSELEDEHFVYGIKYHRGNQVLAEFGEVDRKVCDKMNVKQKVYMAQLDWKSIVKAGAKNKIQVTEISKFPKVRRDLALVIDEKVKFEDILSIAKKTDKKLLKEVNLFDVYKNPEQLGQGKKSYAVSFEFQDTGKTLKDKEVDKIIKTLIYKYENNLGAYIRK